MTAFFFSYHFVYVGCLDLAPVLFVDDMSMHLHLFLSLLFNDLQLVLASSITTTYR